MNARYKISKISTLHRSMHLAQASLPFNCLNDRDSCGEIVWKHLQTHSKRSFICLNNATGSSPYIFLFQLKVPREVTIEAVN